MNLTECPAGFLAADVFFFLAAAAVPVSDEAACAGAAAQASASAVMRQDNRVRTVMAGRSKVRPRNGSAARLVWRKTLALLESLF